MMKNQKTIRGVTLVELMVVVVLIGVLAAIASPGISRAIDRQNARATAAGVANALRTARNQAMSRGTPLWATINPGTTANNRGSIVITRQGGVSTDDAARTCREYDPTNQVEVFRYSPAELSGNGAVRGMEPILGAGPGGVICFSPDGRVLSATGGFLSSLSSANRCDGEDAFIYVADYDKSVVPADHLACPTSPTNQITQRDKRALIRLHKISVPYNGAISVEQ